MPRLLLSLFLSLAALGRAGTFEVHASVDRDQLELGEALQLKVQVDIQGQLDFQPQLEAPNFDGFDVRGPNQQQSMQWVNGSMSMSQALVWELTAVKAGVRSLGPFIIRAKDAKNGDIKKEAPAIKVTVRRPKGLKFPGAQAQPQPSLGAPTGPGGPDDELRDIKPDRSLSWAWIAASILALLGLAFAGLTWWRRRPQGPPPPFVPREPGQWALEQLEKARQALGPGGDQAFALTASRLLRDYLRQRLRLHEEATLSQALRASSRRAESLAGGREMGGRLDLLVYGGVAVEPADSAWAYEQIRAYVIACEQHWPKPTETDKAAPTRRSNKDPKTPK
jgi:hypothetical protein